MSRRSFLSSASGTVGSGWLASQWPLYLAAASAGCSRREEDMGFENISDALGQALAAMAEQIIPSQEDSPGAREAGVVWFMDAWLGSGGSDMLPLFRDGLKVLDGYSGGKGQFVQLGFEQQTHVLKQIETSDFFDDVRFLTLVGMFAMPAHGGNQNKIGWEMIGFQDVHGWQPPFGYYDAELMNENDGT